MSRGRTDHPDWSLLLMGGFRLRHRTRAVTLPAGGQRVVAFLAVGPGPLSRAFVAGTLWPDRSQSRAFANLRSTLWRIRREADGLIEADDHTVGLSPGLTCDVHAVTRSGHEVVRAGANGACDVAPDPRLFGLELLPGWYDEWAVGERERVRQLCLHALETLSASNTLRRRHPAAVQAALAAIRLDPLRESARWTLIRAHLAEGNHSQALREYRTYEQLLADELGLHPSLRLSDLTDRPSGL
jgi:DNA-binding SARP family transcriptional activator